MPKFVRLATCVGTCLCVSTLWLGLSNRHPREKLEGDGAWELHIGGACRQARAAPHS
eukprot:SAG11_NODE_34723_length_270_cov_0.906433_1_plen_56_part_01